MADENNQITASTAIKEALTSSGEELALPVTDLKNFNNKNDGFAETTHTENEMSSDATDIQDQLPQTVMELTCQNAYLVAQFHDFKNQVYASLEKTKDLAVGNEDSQQIKLLQGKISILNQEIMLQKETQKAAEKALEHLRVSNSEEDDKVQDLSVKLVEVQQKMAQEIKERDEKYAELDSKFGRLHKRAKQKIQEIQKEKDDLEAQFRDATVKAEQASSQQSLVHKELERGRQQATEALRSMDIERQQLRATNNKLRDDIDEMHRTLEAKQLSLEESQQTIFKKDQILEDTRRLLQAAEDGKHTSVAELSNKHKEEIENLEDQIAEAVSERDKAAETVSSLQTLIGEKDRMIAELDAASTGEAVRLGAAIEVAKAEISQLKNDLENGKKSWEDSYNTLKVKIEASESACLHSEIEAAKMRSEFELELSRQTQLLNTKDSELRTLKEEIKRFENDFSSYKVRAHALLQKKDAELHAAKDNDIINAQEEAIREAEREVALTLEEKEKALQDLQNALNSHDKEVAAREVALDDAEQRARNLSLKLDSAEAQYQSEKEAWQRNLDALEENWRLKYSALELQKNEISGIDLQSKLKDVMHQYKKLKEEHETFRDIADRMLEEKENEISKFLKENNTLRKTIESGASVNYNGKVNKVVNDDAPNSDIAAAEQQILILARQQAQREEELTQSQRHIMALQEEIEELERENRLHSQQEAMLKEEVRNIERNHKREGVDMTYLKNVILKLLETGEVDALLPVVGTLLQFSPNEMKKCQQTYHALNDASISSGASPAESPAPTMSLFSRFSFS